MVTAGILPFRENSHVRAGNRSRDLMFSSQRLTTRLVTYLLTYYMEQSPWEANRFSASQAIPRILRNPKVHYRTHKCILQSISPGPRFSVWIFRNNIRFYGEELLAPHPTPNMEDYPLSAVRDCLFNIFAATLAIGGRSSIRNLRTRHAVAQGPTYHGQGSLHDD